MFGGDLDALDLGSRRRPGEWVALAPSLPQGKQKRRKGNRSTSAKSQRKEATGIEGSAAGQPGGSSQTSSGGRLQNHLPNLDSCKQTVRKEVKDPRFQCLPPEEEEGNVEYKLRVKEPNPARLQQLITQMKFRLSEGNGECFYYIGVEDDGYTTGLDAQDLQTSLATLSAMAQSLAASAWLLKHLPAPRGRVCALVRVKSEFAEDASYTDVRIAVAGSVDCGKSTLVAVLTRGSGGRPALDCGRGTARMSVLRHKHEIQTGRTSSLATTILGYDQGGRVLNYLGATSALTPAEISAAADKVITFIDMAGHEKYLKTVLYGMTCMVPDYVVLCVCAVGGVAQVTTEHLAVAVALEVPVAVVISKVDLVDEARLAQVVDDVRSLLALALPAPLLPPPSSGGGGGGGGDNESSGRGGCAAPGSSGGGSSGRTEALMPLVADEAAAVAAARALGAAHRAAAATRDGGGSSSSTSGRYGTAATTPTPSCIPIFAASCVSGHNLPLLHAFLRALQPASQLAAAASGADDSGSSAPVAAGARGAAVDTGPPPPPSAATTSAEAAVAAVAAGGLCWRPQAPVHFQIDHTFEVGGVGSVVSGTLLQGVVSVGQTLMLGPTPAGGFTVVAVSCIQRSHIPVKLIRAGQVASLALQPLLHAPAPSPAPSDAAAVASHHSSSWPCASHLGSASCSKAAAKAAAAGAAAAKSRRGASGGESASTPLSALSESEQSQREQSSSSSSSSGSSRLSSSSVAIGSCASQRRRRLLSTAGGTEYDEAVAACSGASDGDASVSDGTAAALDSTSDTDAVLQLSPQALTVSLPARPVVDGDGSSGGGGVGVAGDGACRHAATSSGAAVGDGPGASTTTTTTTTTLSLSLAPSACVIEPQARWAAHVELLSGSGAQPATPLELHRALCDTGYRIPQRPVLLPTRLRPGGHQHGVYCADTRAAGLEPSSECGVLEMAEEFDAQLRLEEQEVKGRQREEAAGQRRCVGGGDRLLATCGDDDDEFEELLLGGGVGDDDDGEQGEVEAGEGFAFGTALEQQQQQQQYWRGWRSTGAGPAAAAAGGVASAAQLAVSDGAHNHRHGKRMVVSPLGTEQAELDLLPGPPPLVLSTSPAPAPLLACSPPNARKGVVLLDAAIRPRTHRQFEAMLILFGGVWPPRGLVSGRWPPLVSDQDGTGGAGLQAQQQEAAAFSDSLLPANGESDASRRASRKQSPGREERAAAGSSSGSSTTSISGATGHQAQQPCSASPKRPALCPSEYVAVVHCGSIRQAARVLSIQEILADADVAAVGSDADVRMSGSIRAAAALLQSRHRHQQRFFAEQHRPCPQEYSRRVAVHRRSGSSGEDGSSEDSGGSASSGSGGAASGSGGSSSNLGCVVRVAFSFIHRPEWLREGARLLVRDRQDGHVAGAGFVSKLVPAVLTDADTTAGDADGLAAAAGLQQGPSDAVTAMLN